MRFLGLIWRGVRDVFEQFVFSIGLSLAWWICAAPLTLAIIATLSQAVPLLFFLLISPFLGVLLPPATVTLFSMADPRRIVSRPDIAETIAVFRTSVKRGWLIGICTVPVLLVLFWNVTFFAGTDSFLAAFVPLWMIMLIAVFILMLYMFSVAGTMESGLRNAFRGAMYVLVSRPFTALLLSLLIVLLGGVMTILVLPMLALGPALMAAVVNRFVLAGLDVEVIDPNAPTSEREVERERGVHHDKTFWERLKGSGRRT